MPEFAVTKSERRVGARNENESRRGSVWTVLNVNKSQYII